MFTMEMNYILLHILIIKSLDICIMPYFFYKLDTLYELELRM